MSCCLWALQECYNDAESAIQRSLKLLSEPLPQDQAEKLCKSTSMLQATCLSLHALRVNGALLKIC